MRNGHGGMNKNWMGPMHDWLTISVWGDGVLDAAHMTYSVTSYNDTSIRRDESTVRVVDACFLRGKSSTTDRHTGGKPPPRGECRHVYLSWRTGFEFCGPAIPRRGQIVRQTCR